MAKLNCGLASLLTTDVLDKLSRRKVDSTLTFIETDPELIARISGLQFRQVVQVRDAILSKLSSKICNGANYYEEFMQNAALLPSGNDKLDCLLDGGFLTGNLYEFCGASSCGKSQLCLSIAANVSLSCQQNVLYFDTKGDFSAHHLCTFVEKKTEMVGETMARIQVCQPQNAYQLLNCLHSYLKQATLKQTETARLIIIDSLAALFYQLIGDHKESFAILSNVCSCLQYIATEQQTAVIVTNLVTNWVNSDSEEVHRASLGKFWSHVPSVRLHMAMLKSSEVVLTVNKSSVLSLGSSTTLNII